MRELPELVLRRWYQYHTDDDVTNSGWAYEVIRSGDWWVWGPYSPIRSVAKKKLPVVFEDNIKNWSNLPLKVAHVAQLVGLDPDTPEPIVRGYLEDNGYLDPV